MQISEKQTEYELDCNKEESLIIPSWTMLDKLLAAKGIEYLVLDSRLTIKSLSPRVRDYSDYPEMLQVGNQGVDAFPELIGLEEVCEKLIKGDCSSFQMKWIARSVNHKRPEYINFYIFSEDSQKLLLDKERLLFVFFEKSELFEIQQRFL